MDEYDETLSQLKRRLPLGTRVRHWIHGWEGTVVGWEYGQVGVKVDEGETCFCYGRNVEKVNQADAP